MKKIDFESTWKGRFLKACLSCVVILALNAQASAENYPELPTDSSTIKLSEVVVTSFKNQKKLEEQPVAVSVLNTATLQVQQIQGMTDLGHLVPNFYMPQYGSKLTTPIYVRGIGNKIGDPAVGLYVDGVPYFDKSLYDFEFGNIEKVEVLRGPQGTLYGRNTMGGVINITTHSPLQYDAVKATITGGKYGRLESSLLVSKPLGDNVGLSVSGRVSHIDGFITNHYKADASGEPTMEGSSHADKRDEASATLVLDWQLSDQWLLKYTQLFNYADENGYPYAQYDLDTKVIADVAYDANSMYRRVMTNSGLGLNFANDMIAFNSQTSFQFTEDKQVIDQDFSVASLYAIQQMTHRRMWSQEFNVKSHHTNSYQWLFGAFGFYQALDREAPAEYYTYGFTNLKFSDMPTRGYAVYHQSTLNHFLIEPLSITAGIRYDFERADLDYDYSRRKDGVVTPMDAFKIHASHEEWSPKLSIQYALPHNQSLYASITRGYKAGGFNTIFETHDEREYKPEYSWNYEIGAKIHTADRRYTAALSAFYITWKDQQIYETLASGRGARLTNAGESYSRGVEASLHARPMDGLHLGVEYGFTDAKFETYHKSEELHYDDNYIPMVPRQTLALMGDYTWAPACTMLDRVTVSANYHATGTTYWKEDNAVSRGFYGLLDAKVKAMKGCLGLELWGRNLLDRDYAAYAFSAFNNYYAQAGRPLEYGATLSVTF